MAAMLAQWIAVGGAVTFALFCRRRWYSHPMQTDPYAPPTAHVADTEVVRGSPLLAIGLGLLVDIGSSLMLGVVFAIGYSAYLIASGAAHNAGEATALLNETVALTSATGLVLACVGLVFSVLGGYVCARIAKHSEYRLGMVMAGLSLLFGLLVSRGTSGLYLNAALALASVTCNMAGVHLGAKKNARRT